MSSTRTIIAGFFGSTLAAGASAVAYYKVQSWQHEDQEKRNQHEKNRLTAEVAFAAGLEFLQKGQYPDAAEQFNNAEKYFDAYCAKDIDAKTDVVINQRRMAALYNQAKSLFHLRKLGDEKTAGTAIFALEKLFALTKGKTEKIDHDALNLKGIIYFKLAVFERRQEFVQKAADIFKKSLIQNETQEDIYKLTLYLDNLPTVPEEKQQTVQMQPKEQKSDADQGSNAKTPVKHDFLYQAILDSSGSSTDFLTNELPMVYAIDFLYTSKGDPLKNLTEAYKYMRIAIDSTAPGPAFHLEKARLYEWQSIICERLSKLIPDQQSVTVTIQSNQKEDITETLTAEKASHLAKEHRERSAEKLAEHEEFQKKLELHRPQALKPPEAPGMTMNGVR